MNRTSVKGLAWHVHIRHRLIEYAIYNNYKTKKFKNQYF